jgi:hypothetical protein
MASRQFHLAKKTNLHPERHSTNVHFGLSRLSVWHGRKWAGSGPFRYAGNREMRARVLRRLRHCAHHAAALRGKSPSRFCSGFCYSDQEMQFDLSRELRLLAMAIPFVHRDCPRIGNDFIVREHGSLTMPAERRLRQKTWHRRFQAAP